MKSQEKSTYDHRVFSIPRMDLRGILPEIVTENVIETGSDEIASEPLTYAKTVSIPRLGIRAVIEFLPFED
jgi:hypothetical protein